jgi:hypothetical protein
MVKNIGEDQWKEEIGYGKRWIVKFYFSDLKRTMGEVIKAIRPDNIAHKIAIKVVHYDEMMGMAEAY